MDVPLSPGGMVLLCALCWVIWKYFRQVFTNSPLDSIPGPPSASFLYGNLAQLLDKRGWDFLQYLTDSYNGVVRLHGPLRHRMLYICDPTALHHVVVKDQHVYEETAWFLKSGMLTLGPGVTASKGEEHRKFRKLLTPAFSAAHMREMIPIFNRVTHQLVQGIQAHVQVHKGSTTELDVLAWMGRTALELIGQAGLGYSFDPLVADSADEYATAVKSLGPTLGEAAFVRRLLPYIPDLGSVARNRALLGLLPSAGARKLKAVTDVMRARASDIFTAKRAALAAGDEVLSQQVGEGRDIISIMLRANMSEKKDNGLLDEEVVGQMTTLIFAAMDTTSTALSLTLTMLCEHPDVQEKLRAEILEAYQVTGGMDLDYDALNSLTYLDAVCRETLRLHAPVATLFRETLENAVLPLSHPIRDANGNETRELFVPKGTTIALGLLSANRNKAIWGEDALEWKPERWLAPLPDSVLDAKIPGVYSNLMTFLGGGRSCIGFKFSQLEMKVVLCLLLRTFTFAASDKPVVWNLAGVRYPTVGNSPKPSLPLKVALYKPVSA